MGFSQDTFYRYQASLQSGGVDALIDANRRKPNLHNRIQAGIEQAVTAFALEQPAFGQVRVCNELRKRGIFVSASAVRCVWLRHNLESFGKRLAALEKHVARTGEVLTEAQVSALEKKHQDDVAQGEIEQDDPQRVLPVALRRKIYRSIEELQADLDEWLFYYNHEHTHQGKMCCGRTPMQTLLDAKEVWNEKVTALNS